MSTTERTNIRDQEWTKNAPDFMVAAIEQVVGARDDIREMLGRLNQLESNVRNQQQVITDRESAVIKAVTDLKTFANQIMGPDSELQKLSRRLDKLPAVEQRLGDLETRVLELEKKTA